MSDIAHKATDKEIEELEKKFLEEYQKALVEMENKASDYFEKFSLKDEQMRARLGMGQITEKEYYSWRNAQMTKGERYNDMINQLAQDMSHTNQMAMAALGDRLPDIYAVNANYAAYEVSKEAGMNLSFTMYDHNTVEKLVKEDSDLLPKPRVSIPEDERWNRGKIRSALTQGILQGDSIPNISKRLQQVTDMNRRAAVRNARTMCTSAQNAGRLARYNEAEDKYGLMFDKVWIATHDSRTRDSHKAIDGEEVSKDEPFSNGLMYPADPDGEPEEVYNCRCTMKSLYTGKKGHETDDVEKFDQKKSFEEYEKEQKEDLFTPAQSIEEAEQYAKDNFVTESKWAGEGMVSYKGMSLDNANAINEELTKLFNQNEITRFRNIGMMNFRQNIWKDSKDAPMAYRGLFDGELFFNPNILKNEKSLEKYVANGKEAFEYCVNNMDKFSGKQLEMVERYKEAGRQTVADSSDNPLKAMLDHEFGHHVDHQIIGKNKEFLEITKDGMDEYGIKLSGYALHTRGEYVAESFCAYTNDLGKIDPKLKEIFEGVKKK